VTPEEKQAVVDEEHLWLLSLFHYISGGMTILGSLMAAAWAVFVGVVATSLPFEGSPNPPDAEQMAAIQMVMAAMAGMVAAVLFCYGVVEIVVGRLISQRRARIFTLVAGLPRIAFIPYGMILTALTFIVLDRSSVQTLYQARLRSPGSSDPGHSYIPPQ
jgi:hypothetical protein